MYKRQAEQYLTFEHDEFTMRPTLDETGRLVPREGLKKVIVDLDFSTVAIKGRQSQGNLFSRYGIHKICLLYTSTHTLSMILIGWGRRLRSRAISMAASTPDMTKMAEIMVNACISDDKMCIRDRVGISSLAAVFHEDVGRAAVYFRGA